MKEEGMDNLAATTNILEVKTAKQMLRSREEIDREEALATMDQEEEEVNNVRGDLVVALAMTVLQDHCPIPCLVD